MGPANQPVSKSTQQQISPQHIPSKHPKFANAIIGTFKDQRTYLQVSQSIGIIISYNRWEKTLEAIKKTIRPNSLYLPLECEYQQQGLCGTAGILKFKFDYFPFLLDQEIANRQYNSLPFEEKQLWFLLYILVQTAAAAHSIGHCVGDIKPQNIFINQTGDISVFNTFSFPEEFNNFQKVRFFKENNYLPPQGVNDIQTGKETPTYDEKVGQSFSIGLTILDAIFLTDHSFLYDKMERFNEIAFRKILDALSNLQINQKLKKILLLMLSMNPNERLTCIQVNEYLAPYEKEIFELENFEIKEELKSKLIKSQKSNSIQASPIASGEKIQAKSRRQNLVRYSLSKSQKRSKPQDSAQKVDHEMINEKPKHPESNSRVVQSSQKQLQRQVPNYSVEASMSSTVKKIQNPTEDSRKKLDSLPANNFESIQLSSSDIKPNLTYVTEVTKKVSSENISINPINRQLHFVEKHEPVKQTEVDNKEPVMVFKTGNLFKRERSSASISQSPQLDKINNIGYQNPKFQIPKLSTTYEHTSIYQKSEFRPSVDYSAISSGSGDHYNDFLKQIDKQIEDSRRLFPDSFK